MGGYKFMPGGSGLIVADEIHNRIHLGQFFSSGFIDTSFSNGEIINIGLVLTRTAHMVFSAQAGVDSLATGYGGAVFSGGTEMLISNHNGHSSKVSGATLYSLPTVSDPGSILQQWLIAGGSGNRRTGADINAFAEFILPPANYLMRLQNLTTNTETASLEFNWYEPEA